MSGIDDPIYQKQMEDIRMQQQLDAMLGRTRVAMNPKPRVAMNPKPKYVRPPSMMTLLRDCAALPTIPEKVARLRDNKHKSLLLVLKSAIDPKCLWTVKQPLHFYPANQLDCGYLYESARRLYVFCQGLERESPVANHDIKRAELFRSFLEEHGADECELILVARKKQLVPGLTSEIIYQAFPELRPLSDAAVNDQIDATRRNARLYAENNLQDVVKESQARIKKLDAQIRENEQQHRELMDLREREFHKIRMAGLRVGGLS
jgi:hypothetical protein